MQKRESFHKEQNMTSYLKIQQLNKDSASETQETQSDEGKSEDVAKFIAQQYGQNNILLEENKPLKIVSEENTDQTLKKQVSP